MTLEAKIPYKETIFQALVLAFWRFQVIAIVELFKAALEAIEERLVKEMQKQYPAPSHYTLWKRFVWILSITTEWVDTLPPIL